MSIEGMPGNPRKTGMIEDIEVPEGYRGEAHGNQARIKHGSPDFYRLLQEMAVLHDRKSHDYASSNNPFGNYYFAGRMSQLFLNSDDAGFMGRLAEKLYRLANLENSQLHPLNETIEDTEKDLCVIMVLWMASRREKRSKNNVDNPTK